MLFFVQSSIIKRNRNVILRNIWMAMAIAILIPIWDFAKPKQTLLIPPENYESLWLMGSSNTHTIKFMFVANSLSSLDFSYSPFYSKATSTCFISFNSSTFSWWEFQNLEQNCLLLQLMLSLQRMLEWYMYMLTCRSLRSQRNSCFW